MFALQKENKPYLFKGDIPCQIPRFFALSFTSVIQAFVPAVVFLVFQEVFLMSFRLFNIVIFTFQILFCPFIISPKRSITR